MSVFCTSIGAWATQHSGFISSSSTGYEWRSAIGGSGHFNFVLFLILQIMNTLVYQYLVCLWVDLCFSCFDFNHLVCLYKKLVWTVNWLNLIQWLFCLKWMVVFAMIEQMYELNGLEWLDVCFDQDCSH